MRVVWTAAAARDVWHIYNYLLDFNPRAAMRLAEDLFVAGESLAQSSHRGRPVQGTALRELIAVHPYIIRYRIAGDEVVILRVRHTSRRPTDP